MEGWRAALLGVGIVLVGLGGYWSLDGVWKGLSLVAAGIALVLLGLSLERGSRTGAGTGGDAVAEVESDELDVTVPMAAVAVEEAEPTAPILRTGLEPVAEPAPAASEPEGPAPDASEAAEDEGDTAHSHDQPMLGHSELVSHIRDYHEGVPFDGSTIQLRLLHERARA
jgi:hypothetical protein